MKNWTKHFIPNVGTLLIVGLLLLAQNVAAQQTIGRKTQAPSGFEGATRGSIEGALSPSSMLFSYQGQLLDANGDPVDGSVEMTFSLYHQESGGTPFWTEAYTTTQAITVTNGLFHVLLGSLTPIDPADLTDDLYLELTVNGETMTPRELLTSVAYAVEAETLAAGASTRGDLNVPGAFSVDGELALGTALRSSGNPSGHPIIGTNGPALEVRPPQDDVPDNGIFIYDGNTSNHIRFWVGANAQVDACQGDGSSLNLYLQPTGGTTTLGGRLTTEGGVTVNDDGTTMIEGDLQVGDNSWTPSFAGMDGNDLAVKGQIEQSGSNGARFYKIGIGTDPGTNPGTLKMGGNINFNGHTATNCGALTEANLQTPEELAADRIDRFEEGDVLCWGIDRLEKCAVANDRLIQAVADTNGRPIVLGAEMVKVLGPVQRGELLVASDVPGYAMVNNDPPAGAVIAQALEDLDGEQGIIKAMIRKF